MGSSLILQGGAAVAKTLKESVTQTGHGFTVGDVIRWDGLQVPPKYVKAIADTAQNAEVAGVVSSTPDPNEFEVTYHGYIDLPSLAGISAPVMFLSGSAGGSLAASPPSAVGTVVKPVLTKNSNGSGYLVMNYLGTQIGGSSTIAVDEIQPVGTIMPYAGTAIPDTWLACDGSAYQITDYPELYSKLCYSTGDRVPMYGHIAELTLSAIPNGTVVGDFILIPTSGNSFPATAAVTEDSVIGPIILAEGQIASIDTVNKKLTVITTWKYNESKKYFEYPNAAFKPASNYTVINPGAWISSNVRGTLNGTVVTGVVITHFLSPDLSSRFIVGSLGTGFAGQPENATFSKASIEEDNSRIKTYEQGAFGGEESHILTTAEIPSHTHSATVTVTDPGHTHGMTFDNNNQNGLIPNGGNGTNVTGTSQVRSTTSNTTGISVSVTNSNTGSNTPHNNMPPYLAVRYIIKAKPYTRAAIIDGIDLPYNSLLVRDLRSRNVGGSNGDLVFHTNTSGDSGNGTERMRLTRNGLRIVQEDGYTCGIELIGAGSNPGTATTTATAPFLKFYNPETSENRYTWLSPRDNYALAIEVSHDSTGGGSAPYSSGGVGRTGCFYITQFGDVGVMTSSPGATLDVNGTLKVGNFDGATNVMPKPTMSSGVGRVVPLMCYGGGAPTTLLTDGTWFVFFTGYMNGQGSSSSGAVDENSVVSGAFTVTLTSSQFLGLQVTHDANTGVRSTTANLDQSGVIYRIFSDANSQNTSVGVTSNTTTHAPPSGWTEFTEGSSSPFKAKRYAWVATSGGSSPTLSDGASVVYMTASSIGWVTGLNGYAIRIA